MAILNQTLKHNQKRQRETESETEKVIEWLPQTMYTYKQSALLPHYIFIEPWPEQFA